MLIILDNAEFILDQQGTDGQEIRAVVEELCRFNNICICITSRTPTAPLDCRRLDVPTLSMGAARDTFYRIYDSDNQSNSADGILELLDFHPLSITLLAAVGHQNKWDTNQLTRDWERLRTSILQTEQNKSLAAAIELSLTSPLLQELGPDARAILGVVAFFPQGVNGDDLYQLFPTISNRTEVFNEFSTLSLTYRSDGFITMLAPLRNYFSLKDPKLSPLLCTTKEYYFSRMSASTDLADPGTQWIMSEDLNVEHLLDVFTTIDRESNDVWNTCAKFMEHLIQRKNRLTILRLQPNIEALPDNHLSKRECLFLLSRSFNSVGNQVESKRLLTHVLKLEREWGDDRGVAHKLRCLSDTNRDMGLRDEGIQQVKEALEIYKQLGDTVAQGWCLVGLARLLESDGQLGAAEEAASHAISLVPEEEDQSLAFHSHYVLGKVYHSKKKDEAAIQNYEAALGIAPALSGHDRDLLFDVHCSLADVLGDELRADEAKAHLEHAELYAADNPRRLRDVARQRVDLFALTHLIGGLMSGALAPTKVSALLNHETFGMELQDDQADEVDELWYKAVPHFKKFGSIGQCRDLYEQYGAEQVRSEALRAADIGVGAMGGAEAAKDYEFVRFMKVFDRMTASGSSGSNCEPLQTLLFPARINSPFQAQGTK